MTHCFGPPAHHHHWGDVVNGRRGISPSGSSGALAPPARTEIIFPGCFEGPGGGRREAPRPNGAKVPTCWPLGWGVWGGRKLKSCFSQPSRTASWGRLWDGLCGTLGNARICAKTKGNHHVGRSRQGVRRRPGAFVGRPGASWVRLGASWGRLGGSSARLEPSWGRPGTSWRPLGGRPGSSWVVLGPAWAVQGRAGAVLGSSWGRPGAVLGRPGSLLAVLRLSWGRFGLLGTPPGRPQTSPNLFF